MMLTIELPFPNAALFPNRKNGRHWSATSALKSKAYEVGYMLTFQAVNRHTGAWYPLNGDVPLSLTFCQPDKRNRDSDNMLAASKSLLDGVATALTINDKQFSPITIRRGDVRKGGAVILEIGK